MYLLHYVIALYCIIDCYTIDPVESPRVLPAVGNHRLEQRIDMEAEDEDVARERVRVEQGAGVNDLISLQHLRKVYAPRGNLPTPTVAVRISHTRPHNRQAPKRLIPYSQTP
jgi:hypothetical protein